jgi:hypothetical protein
METGKAVALAGITATAVVGIAGATASWLTARDDRANQRALAHADRVYDRRADAYLTALAVIQQQRDQILGDAIAWRSEIAGVGSSGPKKLRMAGSNDANLSARLTAFGSPRIVAAYRRLHSIAEPLYIDETTAWNELTTNRRCPECGGRPPRDVATSMSLELFRSLKIFEQRQRQFELLVQRELS